MTSKKQQPKNTASYRNRIVGTADVDPTTLKPNPRNWRGHTGAQSAALKEILSTVGWVTDVIVNKTTGNLIDGHLRVETAIKNHEKSIPVKYVELTEDEEHMVLATFDPIAAMAEADEKMLQELVNSIPQDEIDMSKFDLGIDLAPKHTEEELEDVPPVPRVAKTQRGDMFRLGRHVLMCGDATDADDVTKLMKGGENVTMCADIAFTSPPYNAGFGDNITKSDRKSKYQNLDDDLPQEEYLKFLHKYIDIANKNSKYNFINIQMLANNKHAVLQMFHDYRDSIADIIIWDKLRSQPAIAENVLNSEYEFVVCMSEKASRAIGTIPFRGTLKNIIHIPKRENNEFSDIHNATYPIDLAKYFVENFAANSVLDLFGGTGTTLIACEELDRKCRMMEIEPIYCDVIIERWEKLTGQHAEKITE